MSASGGEDDGDFEAAYADLPTVAAAAEAEAQSAAHKLAAAEKEIERLRAEVAQLRKAERVWAKQRGVLLHNLGALYRTARAEMARKERRAGARDGARDGARPEQHK